MKTFVLTMTTAVLIATPAIALKGMHGGKGRGVQQHQISEEQKKAAQKLERDYNAALESIPDKTFDPWGAVRSATKK